MAEKMLAKDISAKFAEMHPDKFEEWKATTKSKRAVPPLTWWKAQGYKMEGKRPAKGSEEAKARMALVREAKLNKDSTKRALGYGQETEKTYKIAKENAGKKAKDHPHWVDHMPDMGMVDPVEAYRAGKAQERAKAQAKTK